MSLFNMEVKTTFSSLLDLVDSHLSKVSLKPQGESSNENSPNMLISSHMSASIEMVNPFKPKESDITNILQGQLSNMLQAKERKKKEEELMKNSVVLLKNNEDDDLVDLTLALQEKVISNDAYQTLQKDKSTNSSTELLFNQLSLDSGVDFDSDKETQISETYDLPCIINREYSWEWNGQRAKSSKFCKVLGARYRPFPVSYDKVRKKCLSNIQRFDFNSKSPCDLNIERAKKPNFNM